MKRWFLLAPLLSLVCACDVASVREAPSAIAHNQCQSAADCGGGSCVDMQCRTNTGTLQTVLFEVTPPADNSAIAGLQFLVPKDVSDGQGSLELGQIAQVSGRVTAMKRSCTALFGDAGNELVATRDTSMPAQLSLVPATNKLGLYSPRAIVQSEVSSDATYFGFSVSVPPGFYDIYVEPKRQPDQSCPIPPQLLLKQEIKAGLLQLGIDLPEPSMFEFHVSWQSEGETLDGWVVDMLDPVSGRVISNRVPLTVASKTDDGKTDYRATLAYSSVTGVGAASLQQQDQLLRLSPPDGLADTDAKPTIFMARSALGLFKPGSGTLTGFSSLPAPVRVFGQVTSVGQIDPGKVGPQPVAATITLAATEITGLDRGVLASFVRTVTVSDNGKPFEVYLLPGKYRVSTVPLLSIDPSRTNDTTFAADVRTWTVPSSPEVQQGKLIELSRSLAVFGQVLDASGDPVATAQVQAAPSPQSLSQPDYLLESLDGSPFVPRATASEVTSSGNFALKTDPGTFDITVRPNANTGFAWLVMPNVEVRAPNGLGLGSVSMPLPVPYRGTVTMADSADVVPGALVRAYIYVKDGAYTTEDDLSAQSVLQVAETRAGKDGVFDVLIPAQLN